VAAAEEEVKQVRANYFPQLTLSGIGKVGLSGATSALGLPGFPASPFHRNTAYSANWYQTIFDFGRTKHLVASRQALSESARLRKKTEEDRIVLAVHRAYFNVLEAQQLQRVAEETVKERRLTLEQVQAYYKAGLRSQLDVSLAETSLAEAQGNLIQARSAVATAFAALQVAIGLDGAQQYELETPPTAILSLQPLEDLVQAGFQNRPDLHALDLKIRAFGEEVGFASAERLPEIRGFAAGGQCRFNGTTVKPIQRHGLGALGFIFPFFTGGRLEAVRAEAEADLQGAMASRMELKQQIRLEVTQAYYQLLDLAERTEVASLQQRAAHEALDLAKARFQVGLSSFLDVLTAEVAAARADTNYARVQFDYQRARAGLAFATGQETLGPK
jgi:outer membrane protein